jgi:hypothetical protein
MRALFVVLLHPNIEITLQLVDGLVDFLAEHHAIELVEHGSMEAFADSVGLRALGLGAGVIDVLDGEIELVVVMLGVAAILRAAIRQQCQEETIPPEPKAPTKGTARRSSPLTKLVSNSDGSPASKRAAPSCTLAIHR